MNLTPLKYLLFIENVTCVFRNYLCLSKCTRIFAGCLVFIEVINVAVNLVSYLYEGEVQLKAQRIYLFSVTGFSIYVMIASLYYARKFHLLLSNFNAFHNFSDDVVYSQNMSKAQKCLTALVVLFCTVKMLVFSYVRMAEGDTGVGLIATTLAHYNISVCDFRYIFQYFILHCILFVISEQLNAITRSIDSDILKTENKGILEGEDISMRIRASSNCLKKLDTWVDAYENINDSSNLCKAMFSVQLTIMLLIVTTYYIMLLYSITILTVEGVPTPSTLFINMFSMVVFLMALFVISRGGQKIQNSSMKLRQKLCELCIHSLENEQYYKLAKDLLRCVRTRPVRVHVFGSLDVNMSLLPSVVAFFTSYTVIVLQFNNVL